MCNVGRFLGTSLKADGCQRFVFFRSARERICSARRAFNRDEHCARRAERRRWRYLYSGKRGREGGGGKEASEAPTLFPSEGEAFDEKAI